MEPHLRPGHPSDLPSERSFGLLFAAIFLALGGYLGHLGQSVPAVLSLAGGAAILALAAFAPGRLAPFNRAWFALGMLLARVVNPLVLGLLFFLLITPYAVVLRLMRRDALRLRLEPGASSYWIDREPPGPSPDSLPRQY